MIKRVFLKRPPTPRTDALVYADMDSFPIKEWVAADFARSLERELANKGAVDVGKLKILALELDEALMGARPTKDDSTHILRQMEKRHRLILGFFYKAAALSGQQSAATQEARTSTSKEDSRVPPAAAAPDKWWECQFAHCQQFKKCWKPSECTNVPQGCDCPCKDDCDEAGECLKAMGMGCGGSWPT